MYIYIQLKMDGNFTEELINLSIGITTKEDIKALAEENLLTSIALLAEEKQTKNAVRMALTMGSTIVAL